MRSGPPQQLIEKNRDPMPVRYSEPRAPAREQQAVRPVKQYASEDQQDASYSFGKNDQKSFQTQGPPQPYQKVNPR